MIPIPKSRNRYLVTGAAGFIGARVVARLLDAGELVVGIDNLNDYYDPRLKRHRLDQLAQSNFQFRKLDIEDTDGLTRLFDEFAFTAVINLAARAGVRYSVENPKVYFSTNVMGNLALLEEMRRTNVMKYVVASSSSLYAGQPMPFRESLPVNEPVSPYAASKKAAEVTTYTYHHLFNIDATVLRFFTVYGPAGRPDMAVFRFIRWIDSGEPIQLFGDGSHSRDFTYVEDIAAGVVAGLRPLGFEVINLGGGQHPIAMSEVIRELESLLDKPAKVHESAAHTADLKATWADIAKAQALLDWHPRTSLREGLRQTVEWYRAHRDFVRGLHL